MKISVSIKSIILCGFLSVTSLLQAVTITADYCSTPGKVILTASSSKTYAWNTGATTQSITVSYAGIYSVTAIDNSNNSSTASLNVGSERVTNGNFSSGNNGFTTGYTNNQTSIWNEGTYAITTNATTQHPNLKGTDHTSGTGNFMAVNGNSSSNATVWSETITVAANTNYYFSAWACGIGPGGNEAQLQFKINGTLLGSVFTVTPYVWNQFYISWNSGSSTSAVITIVDSQTAASGNDFGLDDISFSTLSPVSLSAAASSNSPICAGSTLNLTGTPTGGSYPLTYSWTGPNSYTSTSQSPSISNTTTAMAGTYSLKVTDANNCTSTATTTVIISKPTVAIASSAGTTIYNGNGTTLTASGASTYTWSPATGLSSTSGTSVTASPATTTTYTATGTDSYGCSNTATITITVLPAANLQIAKSVSSANPYTGSNITFTITATNGGPNNATGVVAIDKLPSGFTYQSATATQGTYDNSTGIWTIGAMANGATATLTIVATVNP